MRIARPRSPAVPCPRTRPAATAAASTIWERWPSAPRRSAPTAPMPWRTLAFSPTWEATPVFRMLVNGGGRPALQRFSIHAGLLVSLQGDVHRDAFLSSSLTAFLNDGHLEALPLGL